MNFDVLVWVFCLCEWGKIELVSDSSNKLVRLSCSLSVSKFGKCSCFQ